MPLNFKVAQKEEERKLGALRKLHRRLPQGPCDKSERYYSHKRYINFLQGQTEVYTGLKLTVIVQRTV